MQFLVMGLLTGVLLSIVGCGNDSPTFSFLPAGQSFKQSTSTFNNELDILWVVDNSSSMSPLQTNMVNNFGSFISNFQSKGYDFKMSVTTTEAYKADPNFVGYTAGNANLASFQDGQQDGHGNPTGIFVMTPTTPGLSNIFVSDATTGINGSGDERAFSSMRTALNSNLNSGFLRPSSFFAVIILSDEDDFSLNSRSEDSWGNNNALDHCYVDPTLDQIATTAYSGSHHVSTCANQTAPDTVDSYVQYLDTLTASTGAARRYNVSAITVLDSTCQASHAQQNNANVTIIGQRYIQLANDTSGVTGSICDASYANALSNIQSQIATLSTQFFLQRVPQPTTIVVDVNGAVVPESTTDGWSYDSAANSILFHGAAVPPQNADINVNFIPATILN